MIIVFSFCLAICLIHLFDFCFVVTGVDCNMFASYSSSLFSLSLSLSGVQ